MKRLWIITIIWIHFVMIFAQNSGNYLVVISIDGFRYDYLDPQQTPHLWEIATEGVHASSLQPSFPSKTFPNHYTIVTGLYPAHHGIISNYMVNPYTGRTFSLRDRNAVTDGRWYGGEPIWVTAQRQGIRTAAFFWPGSEVSTEYRRPERFKYYTDTISYQTRMDSIVYWLSLPDSLRPSLVLGYMEFVDHAGHRYGPFAPETKEELRKADDAIGYLVHQLKKLPIWSSINLIVLSDHGMAPLVESKERDIFLSRFIPVDSVMIVGYGTVSMIFEENPVKRQRMYLQLKQNADHFRVFYRHEIPSYLHFSNHPLIGDIVLIADTGYQLESRDSFRKPYGRAGGDHGYDPTDLSMHALFIANGPAFKKKTQVATLYNVDIYPLMCKILDILPAANIDGRLDRIEFILQ